MEPPQPNNKKRVGIVGLGLIGGSLGLDLQKQGYEVYGLVRNSAIVDRAKVRGLAQVIDTNPKILKSCSVIILALPLSQIIKPPKELVTSIPLNAVVTDVGSVKTPVLKVWEKLHPKFIASHPMAGTNEAGIDAGKHDLFKGRPWVATPNEDTDHASLEVIHKLVLSLGSKWITTNSQKHDEAVALISHLPVLVSAALLHTTSQKEEKNSEATLAKLLASTGFLDTTRVGGGNPNLGLDMAMNNTEAILDVVNLYKASLEKLERMLYEKKWDMLSDELSHAQSIRSHFINT